MMTVYTEAFIPYEFKTREECFKYLVSRAVGIKKSLRLVERDMEHLSIRYPISSQVIEITGSQEDLSWVHIELIKNDWYKI